TREATARRPCARTLTKRTSTPEIFPRLASNISTIRIGNGLLRQARIERKSLEATQGALSALFKIDLSGKKGRKTMAAKKKIRIYYRAPSHVPLWKVMEECGFLEKHGLEMDFGSLEGQRKRAAEGLKSGELDVVSGNHHNLYARKALNGDPYVHVAQSNNAWRENYLVMGNGINGLQDVRGKTVAMDDYDGHTGLNVWLYR